MYSQLMKMQFNRYASSYDTHAAVQKKMANTLNRLILQYKASCNRILDIGCGTGNLSRLLAGSQKPETICLNDISRSMLVLAQLKLADHHRLDVQLLEADFEELQLSQQFDLITGNAVFQWFTNLDQAFQKIYQHLQENGLLAFAVFIEGTFHELEYSFHNSYQDQGIPSQNHVLRFPSASVIKQLLEQHPFKLNFFKIKTYQLNYSDPLEFLKSLRGIGASGFENKTIRYRLLKKMLEFYRRDYRTQDNRIQVTYKVLYCIAGKIGQGDPR